MNAPRRISVFVVDDSAVVRQVMTQLLADDPHIELIGTASDPLFAQTRLRQRWPDVIVLDIEMPRMDGLSFLRQIMAEHPTPVVICSSLAESGSKTALEALSAGAVNIITKPKGGLRGFLEDAANDLRGAIKAAAQSNVRLLRGAPLRPVPKLDASAVLPQPAQGAMTRTTERVIALGTSTGGTQALESVLSRLPESIAGIVVVQHMPEKFTAMFAERLNELCRIRVREAQNGDRVLPGSALIAPGGRHMLLHRSGAQYSVEVRDGPVVNRHKPSVDVLFRSVATVAGANAVGVIMTGMGDDGARGLREMRDAGAATIAQDEASCVVFGMPKEAIRLGGADEVMSLLEIPAALVRKTAA